MKSNSFIHISIILFLALIVIFVLLFFLLDANTRRIKPDACASIGSDLAVKAGVNSTSLCTSCPALGCTILNIDNLSLAKKASLDNGCEAFTYDKGILTLLDKKAVGSNTVDTNFDIYYIISS